jgi:ribosomal protein L29
MKMQEITNKTAADLTRMLDEKREALRLSRFGSAGAKSKNVKEQMGFKRDIARILTALNSPKTGSVK